MAPWIARAPCMAGRLGGARVEDDGHRLPRLARAASARQPARRRGAGGRGGLRRRLVVRPPHPVEPRPGRVGVRLVVAGRRHAGDVRAVRRGERARPALPPGDHRPGHRHARRDVPRTADGWRWARARRRTSTSPATPWPPKPSPQRPAARVRRGDPGPAAGRGGERSTATCGSTGPGCGRCPSAPSPSIGAALSEETARWCGGWADGLITVHMPPDRAAADPRRLPRGRRRGQADAGAGQGGVGADRRRGAGRRPRPVAHERLRLAADGRPRDGRAVRGWRPRTCAPTTCGAACWCRPTRSSTPPGCTRCSTSASTRCSSTRCPASRSGSSTRSAPRCCPSSAERR